MATLADFKRLLPPSARRSAGERAYAKGARIFSRGEATSRMYFVVDGEVRLVRTSISGDEIILQRAKSGFLAEASLDQQFYHCDAVAMAPSRVFSVPRESFRQALADPSFNAFWLKHLATELRRARAHSERVSLRSARDRIVHYIDAVGTNGALTLSQSRKDWASELGLTHESLYRTLRTMVDSGELAVDGPRLRLLGDAR